MIVHKMMRVKWLWGPAYNYEGWWLLGIVPLVIRRLR